MSDQQNAIASLIDQWNARLREARERSRSERVGDAQTAYYKGVSETCQQAIADLQPLSGTKPVENPQVTARYLPLSEREVTDMLSRVGLYPRTLRAHADHAFTAVFSRLQPVSQEQRLRLLAEADTRIIILDQGKLADTNEPFIDFAFG